jgi:hypothetical protein
MAATSTPASTRIQVRNLSIVIRILRSSLLCYASAA